MIRLVSMALQAAIAVQSPPLSTTTARSTPPSSGAVTTRSPTTSAPATAEEKTIVVVGKRLQDTESALAACIARQCPPKEEIDASLAHAENQFLAGDYDSAQATLWKARGRNKRYAKDLPVDVADLLRAGSRVAAANGLVDVSRITAIDSLDALKSGLPATDYRIFSQRLAVGDSFFKSGRIVAARDVYNKVAAQAHDAGQPRMEGYALFRLAGLMTAAALVDPVYRNSANDALHRIDQTTAPELAPFRDAAQQLRCRLTGTARDDKRLACARALSGGKASRAELIYSPTIELQGRPDVKITTSNVVNQGDRKPQWADIAFWVAPDGSVRDIDTVRTSPNARGDWLDKVVDALGKRVYRSLDLPAGDPGLRRIERYSLIYNVTPIKNTRVMGRSPVPRLEVLDLTVDPTQS